MAENTVRSFVCRFAACVVATGMLAASCWPARGSDDRGTRQEPKGQRPTAAFLELGGSPLAALLEGRLLENPRAVWLERNAIEEIRREQKLAALMDSAAGRQRVAIGKLLKADLLVLLRHFDAPKEHVELVVCETKRGLRLAVHRVVVTADVEGDVRQLAQLVDQAVAKHGQEIREICAVPPFVSHDLTYDNEHLKAAYAKLVEQTVRDRPGLLTVELEEARAIAREVGLAEDEIRRPMPLYLLGEFRHDGQGEKQKATLRMRVMRGERELASREATGLSPADATTFVQRASGELIDKTLGVRPAPPDSQVEAQQLARRAETFHLLGAWEEAAALAEASLLLDKNHRMPREVAVLCLAWLAARHSGNASDPKEVARGIHFYLRALEHFEALQGDIDDLSDEKYREMRVHLFWGVKWGNIFNPYADQVESKRVASELRKRELEILLRMYYAHIRVQPEGASAFIAQAFSDRPERERFDIAYGIIRSVRHLSEAPQLVREVVAASRISLVDPETPETLQFSGRLAALKDPIVDEALAELKQRRARAIAFKARMERDNTDGPAVPLLRSPRVRFERVDISWPPTRRPLEFSLFNKCIPLSHGIDLFWGPGDCLQLMKEPGRLEPIWDQGNESGRLTTITQVEYDGRFCWVPTQSGRFPRMMPGLLIIDPESRRTSSIGQTDGLPLVAQETIPDRVLPRLWIAPLEPGRALFVSWFGRIAIGTIEFDPDTGAVVETFFEARVQRDPRDPDAWRNVYMAFEPEYVWAFRQDSSGGTMRRVVVGSRQGRAHDHPLLVDPDRRAVTVLETGWRSGTDLRTWAVAPEALYRPEESYGKHNLVRIGLPDFAPKTLVEDVPNGCWLKYGEGFLVFGTKCWLVDPSASGKEPVQVVATDLPWPRHSFLVTPDDPEPYCLKVVCRSHHYGLLAIRDHLRHDSEFFRVVFDHGKEAD